MKIQFVHNEYQQRGGEDAVVDEELKLLTGRGHDVRIYKRSNLELAGMPSSTAFANLLWSRDNAKAFSKEIESFRPDVIHVHNTFPLISPSVYWVAARYHIPVVQTLHNFRLMCVQAMLLRNERICEDCVGKVPWRGFVRKCYRDSYMHSGALAAMLTLHRVMRTYSQKVARYIALNEFCKRKFVEGGVPETKITVKPNFVDSPRESVKYDERAGALFVGRLSKEKGIATLRDASQLARNVPVTVAGDGPEIGKLVGIENVSLLGQLEPAETRRRMRRAMCLVMPSIWYENFPRTLVEAFSEGLPVIASRLGAMADLIDDERTGLLFEAGNSADLAQKLAWAESNPEAMRKMGLAARAEFESKYSADKNYEILSGIYRDAIQAVSNA